MSVIFFTVFVSFLSVFVVTVNEGKSDQRIIFPDLMASLYERPKKEIPLSLIRQLNEVSDDDFFELFEYEKDDFDDLSLRMGSKNKGEFSLKAARMAKCMPELQTVSLRPNTSSAVFYYPSCTRVNRCGGCCSHHLLACQPVEKSVVSMRVVVADYLGGNKLQFRGEKVVEVEEHHRCRCECRIRRETCTRYQVYNADKCQCECPNSMEERRCGGERSKKLWNGNTCSCMCREELECGSGYYFDPFTCSCTPYRARKSMFMYNIH